MHAWVRGRRGGCEQLYGACVWAGPGMPGTENPEAKLKAKFEAKLEAKLDFVYYNFVRPRGVAVVQLLPLEHASRRAADYALI